MFVPVLLLAFVQTSKPPAEAVRIAKAFSKALEAKDEGWFERHVAPDFVYVGPKGEQEDRDDTLGHIHRWMHPLGYHVEPSIRLVSGRSTKGGLILVSDLTVRSQLFGFHRMPLTVAKAREQSFWAPKNGDWIVKNIRVLKYEKTVDGQPVRDD